MRSLRWIAVLAATLLPAHGFANSFSLDDLTLGDYDKIVEEFSANFAYSSVTPASSLGGLWGFELGVIGGLTKAPETITLVKRGGSSYDKDIYHGGALVRIGAPLGLTAEATIFPSTKISGVEFGMYSGAAMWTITDIFFTDFPVTMAAKGFFTKASMDYGQRINNASTGGNDVDATVSFDDTLYGAQFLVSRKFLVFEPYLGLGYVKSKGELSVSASLPNISLIPGHTGTASSNPSSAQLLAGLDIRLLFLSLGAEYQKSFGTNSVTGRLSFRF